MSKKIIIGGKLPNEPQPTVWTSTQVTSNGQPIFRNDEGDYSFLHKEFDIEIYIFNDCEENKTLAKLLLESKIEYVEDYISRLIIDKLTPTEILSILDDYYERGFKEGFNKAQDNIRKALGIKQ